MNGISLDWFLNPKNIQKNVFETVSATLLDVDKVPRYAYSILKDPTPVEVENKWVDCLLVLEEIDWNDVHSSNFTCTIETQLRSFYFKFFSQSYLYKSILIQDW